VNIFLLYKYVATIVLVYVKLLPLYENNTFKTVFTKDVEILLDLLNSFPQFQGKNRIRKIRILNPELLGSKKEVKDSILDIHAEDISNRKFLIEMQTSSQRGFTERIVFNWAKVFATSLDKGEEYKTLPIVYSINFLNFSLVKDYTEYLYNFSILEAKHPEIQLTDCMEILIIELPKLKKEFTELSSLLEYWIYLIRAEKLEEKAIKEIKFISLDKENRKLIAARLRAERKFKRDGMLNYQKGIEVARESLYMGIQLTLESRFNSKGLALMPSIEKIKDIEVLKQIMKLAIKSDSLDVIKKILSE
jgi:predicted transposase/invertase (TIGR01784 family)